MIRQTPLSNARIVALMLGAAFITSSKAMADFVIPDDLIVQGSACVGLDCVDGESFGFDTIRLKENNTRIKFDDTSTSPGFPNNDWQLTANDSASGGLNKFSIENITTAKIPFTVLGPAPTNSLFIDGSGRLGLRTATPGLDINIKTGNTPAHRLEQDSSGGFTAQTWDIAGNEANFFVRDITGGSRLPFRIRPGAPTSSIDIAASGSVGFGTASPVLAGGVSDRIILVQAATNPMVAMTNTTANRQWAWYVGSTGELFAFDASAAANRMLISTTGNVGIGTVAPVAQLHTTTSVRFAGVAGCGSGIQTNASGDLSCIVSSRQFKNIVGELAPNVALANVMALKPQTGSYKDTPDVPEHWLIAEDVAAVDPALIGLNDGKPHVVKTQNVVADLIAVVQQQQRRIDALERRLSTRQ